MHSNEAMIPTARPYARLLITALLCLLLAACAGAPKKEKLGLTIQATADVNPDRQGRPSPVTLHILELTSAEQFNSLDYLTLTNPSSGALAADVASRKQVVLAPGGSQTMALEIEPTATAIGLVAGYRDIDNANWRSVVAVSPGKTKSVNVTLEQFQITTSQE